MRTVVVTRPEPEASAWVAQLRAQGQSAIALPMLEIAGLAPTVNTATEQVLQHGTAYNACMFVSGNAVRYGLPMLQTLGLGIAPPIRCWAPGPGTAQALLAAGIASAYIDQPAHHAQQFDSEALWQVVVAQVRPGHRILILRGADNAPDLLDGAGHGRAWLTQQLQHAGAAVDVLAVYARRAPSPSPALQARVQQLLRDGALWLLSSSECARNLVHSDPGADWAQAHVLATHPRIAQACQLLGFGRTILTQPTIQAVLASLESGNEL